MPAGAEADILKGMYLFRRGQSSRTASRPRRACSCSAREPSSAKSSPPPNCSRTTGASMPTSGAARASTNWRATATTCSAGTCSTRPKSRAPVARRKLPRRHARPDRRRHRLRPPVRRADPPLHQPPLRHARHRRLRPLGHARAAAPLLRGRSPLGHLAALKALADDGTIERSKVAEAIAKYGIDVNKPNPMTV
jgi:hypothetical protein